MTLGSPQKRPGTTWIAGGKSKDPGSKGPNPLDGRQSGSTGTKRVAGARNANDAGGKIIEGQDLRGYVHNQAGRSIGAVKDATVAPDGTRRCRSV